MFCIVRDVDLYPQFLPWCGGSQIHRQSEQEMEASVEINMSGMRQRFTTLNRMKPGREISMELVDGPFEVLSGQWRFIPIVEQGCKVELDLNFRFKSGLASRIITPIFSQIANTMVDSFCTRARELDEHSNSD